MVYIPGFLIEKVYDRGSLENTKEGFEFSFRNRMTPMKISGIRDVNIEVDGQRCRPEDVVLELGGKKIEVGSDEIKGTHIFDKDSKLTIRIRGRKLSNGPHTLKIGFITNEYGGATLRVTDRPGKVDFPLLTFVAELLDRLSNSENKYEGVPLRIHGRFPVLNFMLETAEKITGTGAKKVGPMRIEGELGGVPLDPDFARLEAALNREEGDRVPLFEAEIAPPIQEAFLGRQIATAADEIEFYVRAGYDFVSVVPPFFAPRLMRSAASGGEERSWITESEGIIKTLKDVENFPWPTPEEVDFSTFHEVAEILPGKMKIIGMLSPAAIFGNASQAMGLENFSYALYDNPEVIEALFEIIGDTYDKITKKLVTMPRLGAVFMSDDLAHAGGLLVSPKVYKKYVFPWYRKIGETLDAAGLPFIFHSDGRLWEVFDDLADCGISAIHPIEPLAMDIVEVKKKYGDTFCIFGNIDLEYTLTRGTVEDVENQVKERIRALGPGGGWGLAASNSVPDYAKPENYRAMVTAGKKYGSFPISI